MAHNVAQICNDEMQKFTKDGEGRTNCNEKYEQNSQKGSAVCTYDFKPKGWDVKVTSSKFNLFSAFEAANSRKIVHNIMEIFDKTARKVPIESASNCTDFLETTKIHCNFTFKLSDLKFTNRDA